MPKLVVSNDGVIVKEVQLIKDRSTIGRRPYNDVVIDNLAVSGEHAAVQFADGEVVIEDLGSTNGTYVNGKAVKRQALEHGDTIVIGKYQLRYLDGGSTIMGATEIGAHPMSLGAETQRGSGSSTNPRIRVLSGRAAGREMPLTKIVTTVGKPGVCVASITRKAHGYDLTHVDGTDVGTVNGRSLQAKPLTLEHGDQIDLAGIRLEFLNR